MHRRASLARALFGLALVMPAAAWAQTHSGAAVGTHGAQSDSNDWQEAGKTDTTTGKPARSEEAATTGDDFGTLDTDHDGRISRAEAGASEDFSGRFKTLDTDGDGFVSNAEYREGLRSTRTPTSAP
jgi:hypothetical protein